MSKPEAGRFEREPYQPHDSQHSPVVLYQMQKRAEDWQLRLADRITAYAGSMSFVWAHVTIFTVWVATGLFGADQYPFQSLTFVVSLEAIFLSTFVMIAQNRQAAFQQAKADHDFHSAEQELSLNTDITRSIHELTQQIHTIAMELQRGVATPGDAAR